MVVGPDIRNECCCDREIHAVDDEGVGGEGAKMEDLRRIQSRRGVHDEARRCRPHRAANVPPQRPADHEKREVDEERAGRGVGEEAEERKRRQVEQVVRQAPGRRKTYRCPDQREHAEAVDEIQAAGKGETPVIAGIERADRHSQQRAAGENDPAARNQPFDADLWRIFGVPHQRRQTRRTGSGSAAVQPPCRARHLTGQQAG